MNVEERVRGYAGEVVGAGRLAAITSVAAFGGGDRHRVFKVTYADNAGDVAAVVVRVSTRSDAAEREQVDREAAVLSALAGQAAPRLLDVSRDGRWFSAPVMCTEFIDGDHREIAAASAPDLEALGAVVGSVHARPADGLAGLPLGPGAPADHLDQWAGLIDGYQPRIRRPLPPEVESDVGRAVPEAHRLLAGPLRDAWSAAGERPVLLHGDVASGNVLWAQRPVLIDWEYARLGDPADDVAYIFGQHGLSARQREGFWAGYRCSMRSPAVDRIAARARLWEPVILVGSALWWLGRWSDRVAADDAGRADPAAPKPQRYYLEQAVRRLKRLTAMAVRAPGVLGSVHAKFPAAQHAG